ncbi:MAG: hypothetical protein ABR512_05595 [Desulfopila sp.]
MKVQTIGQSGLKVDTRLFNMHKHLLQIPAQLFQPVGGDMLGKIGIHTCGDGQYILPLGWNSEENCIVKSYVILLPADMSVEMVLYLFCQQGRNDFGNLIILS